MKEVKVLETLKRRVTPLTSKVQKDRFTKVAQDCFDFEFDGVNSFYPYEKPTKIPTDFNLGVIVGQSGSGKSTLLREFGIDSRLEWDNGRSIISHFESPEEAIDRLNAVGLSSVPTWTKPYNVLSMGERFRASTARKIKNNAVIDEFTSVVDRNVAKSCSTSLSKYIRKRDIKGVVLATCHKDILEWLEPDWVIDLDMGLMYDGRSLRRPRIDISIYESSYKSWDLFRNHHYLTQDINKASKCFVAKWNGEVVGFASYLPYPSGTLKSAFRCHRVVVLPEYQGLGIGKMLFNFIGQYLFNRSCRLFCRTAHLKAIGFMDNSINWKSTSTSGRKRYEGRENRGGMEGWKVDMERTCNSYEFLSTPYQTKEHYNVKCIYSNKSSDEEIEQKLLELKNYCEKSNLFLVVFVLVGKVNINIIDEVCIKHGIRRENIKQSQKYDIEIDF